MARSTKDTLLPLDRYAEFMSINPCAFNQVYHPDEPYPSDCSDVWLQHGYTGGAGQIVGREDVATAIDTAEKQMADFLGFHPAPKWETKEEHRWPQPKRGIQFEYPIIELDWGYIQGAGIRALTLIEADADIVYSDADGDGVDDTATITVAAATWGASEATISEVAVFYADETEDRYRIRNLDIEENDAGDLVITGPRCYFVDPDYWLDDAELDLSDDTYFLDTDAVDIYRRYNDTTTQAQLVYRGTPCRTCATSLCEDTCQNGCVVIDNYRLSTVMVAPASYDSDDESWSLSTFTNNLIPNAVRCWYQAGLPLQANNRIRSDLAMAIVRLANTYLPKAPCGCDLTRERYERDREEQEMTDINVAMAASHFGTTRRGAVFAMGVCRRLNPIASGGNI